MAVRMVKQIVCDFCGRAVQVDNVCSFKMPSEWVMARDFYGNETHVCPADECGRKFAEGIGQMGSFGVMKNGKTVAVIQ